MLPIAPIISSVITFLQTLSLSTSGMEEGIGKLVTLLQSVMSFFDKLPRIDGRAQLLATGCVIPFAVLAVLVVPFHAGSLCILEFVAAFLVGLFARSPWLSAPLLCVLAVLWAAPFVAACCRGRDGAAACAGCGSSAVSGEDVARELRQYYMTGIVSADGRSCAEIDGMMADFVNSGRFPAVPSPCACACCPENTKRIRLRMIRPAVALGVAIAIALFAVFALAPHVPVGFVAIAAVAAAAIALAAVVEGVKACLGPVNGVSTLFLRVAVVVLEMLYIPNAELLVALLHPYAPCGGGRVSCVAGAAGSPMGVTERNYTCLAVLDEDPLAANRTSCFARSPYGQPWLDYERDVVAPLLPLCIVVLALLGGGLPLLEFAVCRKCKRVIDNCRTTGSTAEQQYEDVLSALHTPLVYTFFVYREPFLHVVPSLLFVYRALLVGLSHVQQFLGIWYAVPPLLLAALLLSIALRAHRHAFCRVLDAAMYALSLAVSVVPPLSRVVFGGDTAAVGKACSIAKAVSACVPVAVFVFVFARQAVLRRRMSAASEMEIEDVVEDGDVLRDRMSELYSGVDKIINREVLDYVGVYSFIYVTASCLAGGFFLSGFLRYR